MRGILPVDPTKHVEYPKRPMMPLLKRALDLVVPCSFSIRLRGPRRASRHDAPGCAWRHCVHHAPPRPHGEYSSLPFARTSVFAGIIRLDSASAATNPLVSSGRVHAPRLNPIHSPCFGDSFLIVDAFSTCVVPFEWSPLSAGQGGAQDPPVGRDHHPPAQGGNCSGGHAQLWLKLSVSLFCRGGQAWPNQGRDRRALICRD